MKHFIAAMIMLAATTASADINGHSQSGSDAQSSAQNSLVFEGQKNVGSGVFSSSNNTAPCLKAYGLGLGIVGLGVGVSLPAIEQNCLTQSEAKFLHSVLSLPYRTKTQELARRAAIRHACANDESLRETLVYLGVCKVVKPSAKKQLASDER